MVFYAVCAISLQKEISHLFPESRHFHWVDMFCQHNKFLHVALLGYVPSYFLFYTSTILFSFLTILPGIDPS